MQTLHLENLGWMKCYLFPTLASRYLNFEMNVKKGTKVLFKFLVHIKLSFKHVSRSPSHKLQSSILGCQEYNSKTQMAVMVRFCCHFTLYLLIHGQEPASLPI